MHLIRMEPVTRKKTKKLKAAAKYNKNFKKLKKAFRQAKEDEV